MDGKIMHSFSKTEIMAALFLFRHCKEKFNPRQLAKTLGINHAHANGLCLRLHAKLLLEKEDLGNSCYYSFSYTGPALHFATYLLYLETFPEWLKSVRYHLRKFEEHVQLGLIFGSSIQSKKYNDIDVLLMYEPGKKKTITAIKEEIRKSNITIQPIRYVEITEYDIEKNRENDIFYSILKDSLLWKGPEKYVEALRCLKGTGI